MVAWHKYLTHRISIVNFYHGSYDPRYGNPEFIDSFLSTAHLIDVVVTSCSITVSSLSWGIPSSKIHLIHWALMSLSAFPHLFLE